MIGGKSLIKCKKVVLDDVEEVSSVCQQCGFNRVWEDSPLGFADYWKESVNDER